MKRKMSYEKLWKLLIDRDMKRTDLRKNAGISSSSLAKLGKDENVTTDVLLRICDSLDVELNESEKRCGTEQDTVAPVKPDRRSCQDCRPAHAVWVRETKIVRKKHGKGG